MTAVSKRSYYRLDGSLYSRSDGSEFRIFQDETQQWAPLSNSSIIAKLILEGNRFKISPNELQKILKEKEISILSEKNC